MFALFLGEFLQDFNLVLMLFAFITIASFVRNHLGNSPLSWVAMVIVGGIVFLSGFWNFFGGVFVVYLLLMLGISGLIIDFFFVAPRPGGRQGSPMSSGVDLAGRVKQMQQSRGNFAQQFRRGR